jgi:xanthine dehydrogenase YagS FAD-binding subunit
MTRFPKTTIDAWSQKGIFRSGATDVWDRKRKGLLKGMHVDLRDVVEMTGALSFSEEGLVTIPAMMSISDLAKAAPRIGHMGLTQAASDLATPAIRNVARVGGNLMQEVRCAYFRSGNISCLKTGGEGCPARDGDHRYLSAVDLGGCIAPHPSTLALAFAALGASVRCIEGGEEHEIPIETLWLEPARRLILSIQVQMAKEGMYSSWYRISNRRFAEWAVVEVVVWKRRMGMLEGLHVLPFLCLISLGNGEGKSSRI